MTGSKLWVIRLIWVAITGLLAALWRAEALALLVGLIFIGPLLRETGLTRDADERERMLHMQAGYYGFLAAMMVVSVVMIWQLMVQQKELDPTWYLVLAVPLLVRGSFYAVREAGWRKLGLGLGFTIGGIWTAFTLLSHGLTLEGLIESAVGLSILIPTALALKWPRVGGLILVLLGITAALFFTRAWARFQDPATIVLMYCLMPLPLVLAGIALLRSGVSRDGMAEEGGPSV